MAEYQQLLADPLTGDISGTVYRRADGAYIPDDPANRDRAAYTQWLDEGNTPDPPPEPPEPPPPEPVTLPAVMPAAPTDAVPKAYVDVELKKLEDEQIAPLRDRIAALEAPA